MRKASRIAETVKVLEEIVEKERQTQTNGGSTDRRNGEHCEVFKEIPEKELLVHLQNGWEIVHNLQNGNVIVKR